MSTALAKPNGAELAVVDHWSDKIELIQQTVAKGCSKLELDLFLYTAKKRGLDPLTKQIYAIKRGGVMTIQTGIDGFRCVAGRTGQLAGIEDAVCEPEGQKHPFRATVTVYRMVGNTRCPFTATARWEEYAQTNGQMWAKMPYTMLAKCAEALALRKAFPEDLSGIYTFDEMAQADNTEPVTIKPTARKASPVASLKTEVTIEAESGGSGDLGISEDDVQAATELFAEAAPERSTVTQPAGWGKPTDFKPQTFPAGGKMATDKQVKLIHAKAANKLLSTQQLKDIIGALGYESLDELPIGKVNDVLAAIDKAQ